MKFHEHTSWIKTPDRLQDHLVDQDGNNIKLIGPLQKINIVIGTNNSGKSLLLRELTRQVIDKTYISKGLIATLNTDIINTREKILSYFPNKNYSFFSNNGEFSARDIENILPLIDEKNPIENNVVAIENSIKISSSGFNRYGTSSSYTHVQSNNVANTNITHELTKIKNKIEGAKLTKNYSKIYIPTIRTLRVYKDNQELENKTREEYSFKINDNRLDQDIPSNITIQNGQSFYDQIFYLRNSTHEEEDKLYKYQEFLSKFFFDNEEISFITDNKKKIINIKIGNEKAQPIQHLGDGLQMIIIITFPFFNYDSGIVIIEEPELFIHPSLQQTLMSVLSNSPLTDNFQTFAVTHSNHIINFSTHDSNTSIFSINKIKSLNKNSLPSFKLSNISYGDTSVLDLIGANKSSVFLSNCSIWIEGVTDKLYLNTILEKYCKSSKASKNHRNLYEKLKEGLHYIFVYSTGDNIVHLDFESSSLLETVSKKVPIKFLCGKAMVLIDDDNNKNPERKRILSKVLKFDLNILRVSEIENLLSPDALFKTWIATQAFKNWQ